MKTRREIDGRYLLLIGVLFLYYVVIVITFTAIFVTLKSHDEHWLNRFGGMVVTMSLGLSLLQFAYERWMESRLERNHRDRKDDDSARELQQYGLSLFEANSKHAKVLAMERQDLQRMRWIILANTLCTGVVGEVLHTFGDLICKHAP
ncbi:hypothetical protein [Roseiarcus fermentans]|uniref:hypothetical protein n=1 Tax=Roseiarcus fermentans TaxID=1473586 RepID=UPI0011BDB9DF|nr:hypothetical protein [Roseiarcus fermentans]